MNEINRVASHINEITPRTRLVFESFHSFDNITGNMTHSDIKLIELERGNIFSSRIRLNQALFGIQNSTDFTFPTIQGRSQERKLQFIDLSYEILSNNELIDYDS